MSGCRDRAVKGTQEWPESLVNSELEGRVPRRIAGMPRAVVPATAKWRPGVAVDPTDKRRAWVNIQHPDTGDDKTIEITIRVR